MTNTILVTGGAGYIGSHTVVELLNSGYQVVVLDNLSNASVTALQRVERLTGRTVSFIEGDVRDSGDLDALFAAHPIDAVIHFAALKAVGESVEKPLAYYDNNVTGLLSLLAAMQRAGVFKLVFSSSATVYGECNPIPYREPMPRSATSPYGWSKVICEQLLSDMAGADRRWQLLALRYFNPVGAHPSGEIGEDPEGIPNNLMPFISQVAVGRRAELAVFGDDYPTVDGTGVRDYLHVVDVARGHLAGLAALVAGFEAINLGAGRGYSVLEVIRAFEAASGVAIPYRIEPRRSGDIAEFYADASLAAQRLNWRAEKTLAQICADSWRWQRGNPDGYRS